MDMIDNTMTVAMTRECIPVTDSEKKRKQPFDNNNGDNDDTDTYKKICKNQKPTHRINSITNKIRVIKDCIYGHFAIPELCSKFVDVPEFQRLRRVRQLGLVHYIYPSATHTRFEHSLGVMHLAGRMVDQLRNFVQIDQRTKQLIQLAGMYHDIGHFAFSHLFDSTLHLFTKNDNKYMLHDIFKYTDHEFRSIYFLTKVNQRLGLLSPQEEEFVINLIKGQIPESDSQRGYLYQIICNDESGIDVDKMDYLRRDAYHTGFPGFQSDYIIINAMIDSENRIAFRKKTKSDLNDLYNTRTKMHINVYQHHTSKELEKIHYCAMKRLGHRLFAYGEQTDDYNIDTLIHGSPDLSDLIHCIEYRELDHECENCKEYDTRISIPDSGSIDRVRFI
jgi:HD superfamily phosphohydrolase